MLMIAPEPRAGMAGTAGTAARASRVTAVTCTPIRPDRTCGSGRVAQGAVHVRLQAGDPAAGLGQPHHLGEHFGGFGHVHQQGAGVHQVE